MKNLNYFLNEQMLNEKLITFSNTAYPKFNNVVILAGGGGSGKGFVLKNLVGLEGNIFDVDALKSLSLKSNLIKQKIKDETGRDAETISMKDPKDVYFLHNVLAHTLKITDKREQSKFSTILTAPDDRKPNLIFDTTLSSLKKLRDVTDNLKELGYKSENIHIVWVINSFEIARNQNANRKRVVPEEILIDAHRGASQTLKDIYDMGSDLGKYMDGDIWYVFNDKVTIKQSDVGGKFISDVNTIKVKNSGSSLDKSKITKEVLDKIISLVPKSNTWDNEDN